MTQRIGNYIQTYGGTLFWPLDPRPCEVNVVDIAHSLSQQCRWTGHTRLPYSVAQHACMVAELVRPIAPHLAYAALHHDSAEAYLSDICSPTKQNLFFRYENLAGMVVEESFTDAEGRVEDAIFAALEIKAPDKAGEATIKTADRAALRYECQHLMHKFPDDEWIYQIGLIDREWKTPWSPETARYEFLELHQILKAYHV